MMHWLKTNLSTNFNCKINSLQLSIHVFIRLFNYKVEKLTTTRNAVSFQKMKYSNGHLATFRFDVMACLELSVYFTPEGAICQ